MLANIRDILIITNPNEGDNFKKIIGDGSNFGIKIEYLEQKKPNGLPEAFIIGEKFINNQSIALILGDNFFYGQGFTNRLREVTKQKTGSTIFVYGVNNPQDYGIIEMHNKKIINIKEKPKKSKSNLAITGLYFFDKSVVSLSKKLKPSKRKEIEIVDLIKKYQIKNKIKVEFMGRGSVWLDTGNVESFFETSQYIATVEKRQGQKIACLEEIALNNKWINKSKIIEQIKFYGNCDYSKYLRKLITNNENKN
jgi:glucose-1-phosphate thymidylyltransferase